MSLNKRTTILTSNDTGVGKVIRTALPVILSSLGECSSRHESAVELEASLSLMETIVTERVSAIGTV